MQTVWTLNIILIIILILLDGHLLVFAALALFRKPKPLAPCEKKNRYAVLICARNEASVIAQLLDSINMQTYPKSLLDTFVMADNCTDDTADIARAYGAVVYKRSDLTKVGKGYALDALFKHLATDYPGVYDGYFLIDADNVLAPDYAERMNEAFEAGYELVSGYHNTKNLDQSLFTMGAGLMFLILNRFFNYPRNVFGLGAYSSGTGILISDSVIREAGGWPYHMITEDLEFMFSQLLKGRHYYQCRDAVFYDEKPVSYKDTKNQLLRWEKGYLQVVRRLGPSLIKRAGHDFTCYDLVMCYVPAGMCFVASLAFSFCTGIWLAAEGYGPAACCLPFLSTVTAAFILLFLPALATILLERDRIALAGSKIILAAAAHSIYMFIFGALSLASLFCKTGWKDQ